MLRPRKDCRGQPVGKLCPKQQGDRAKEQLKLTTAVPANRAITYILVWREGIGNS